MPKVRGSKLCGLGQGTGRLDEVRQSRLQTRLPLMVAVHLSPTPHEDHVAVLEASTGC